MDDVPDAFRAHPALWRDHLDKFLEPRLTPEEQAEKDAAEAAAATERLEREWESWGTSPEQLAQQSTMMAMAGPEG